MLQIHYGLNQPFNSAFTPARAPSVAGTTFVVGTWIKLSAGLAVQAGAGDPTTCEIVFEDNSRNATGVVPTIYGKFEATTDQYTGTIADGDFLKIGASGKLVTDGTSGSTVQTLLSIAQAVGAASGGYVRFKMI